MAPALEALDGFDLAVRQYLGNDLIEQLSAAFWDVYVIVAPHLDVFTHEHEAATIANHQRIVDAVRDRDPVEFAAALTEHYAPVRKRIAEARARR